MKNPSDKDWKSMESEWRERIQDEISPVPEGLWEKISVRLDAEEKPKVFFIKTWQWVAIVTVTFGLGWLWFLPSREVVALKTKSTSKASILPNLKIEKENKGKTMADEAIKFTDIAIQKLDKKRVPTLPKIEKNIIEVPTAAATVEVVVQQNSTIAANKDKTSEKEEAIWVQVEIDPIQPITEEKVTTSEVPEMKKRNIGLLLKKIKHVLKGNLGEWSEIKEDFHMVANKYIQTEVTIKQKFKIQ
jgi:hypothetical protein